MQTQRPMTVALAIGSAGRGLERSSASVADGVLRYAAEQKWEIIDLRSWRGEVPVGAAADGLIYESTISTRELRPAIFRDIPLRVEIDPAHNHNSLCGVATDPEALGSLAAEYYLERGFRNFALAAYQAAEWVGRLTVFRKRIEQAGGTCQSIRGMNLPAESGMDMVRDSVIGQLRELTYPLGIFCTNDRLALRLCRWCKEAGIPVPEQAAILGFGNDTITCGSSAVPLSSISPNYERLGLEAARLLHRMMAGERVPEGYMVRIPPNEVITRRSTDIMATRDLAVANALRYIWDHYREPIRPASIANFCGVALRTLERRFKKVMGRTMGSEIMRRRLSKARDLLTTGEMPAIDIAAELGFGTPQYFSYQFKKKFGIPPQTYRERERGTVSPQGHQAE